MLQILNIIKKFISNHRSKTFYIVSLAIIVQTLMMAPALILGKIIDFLQIHSFNESLQWTMLFFFSTFLISTLWFSQITILLRMINMSLVSQGIYWCKSILKKDYAIFDKFEVGSLVRSYDRGMIAISRLYSSFWDSFLYNFLKTFAVLLYINYLGQHLAVVILLIFSLFFLSISLYAIKKRRPILAKVNALRDLITSNHAKLFEAMPSLQSAGALHSAPKHLYKNYKDYANYEVKNAIWSSIIDSLNSLFPGIVSICILFFSIYTNRNSNNILSSGDYVVMFVIVSELIQSWSSMIHFIPQVDQFIEDQKNINEAVCFKNNREKCHEYLKTTDAPHKITINPFMYRFSNNSSKELICEDPIEILPKKKVAIIGSSGQGKTTFARIISGLIFTENIVSIENIDISKLSDKSIHQNLHFCYHKTEFLHGSFNQSVMFGKNVFDTSLQKKILYDLSLNEIFDNMDNDNFDIKKLSSGQRKRLGIMRACILHRPITLFDEPTESLDKKASILVWNTIFQHFSNHTLICLTHNQKILNKFDNIIDISNHKITLTK